MIPGLCALVLTAAMGTAASPGPTAAAPSATEKEFCRIDADQDRSITLDEFSACEFHRLERIRRLPYSDPELFGAGQARELSEEELKQYLFRRADKNRDHRIDRHEWEEFFRPLVQEH